MTVDLERNTNASANWMAARCAKGNDGLYFVGRHVGVIIDDVRESGIPEEEIRTHDGAKATVAAV